MALEWLKTILGDGYTEDIESKIAQEIGKGFVSKADFNAVKTQQKKLEDDLKTRDTQLEELKKATGTAEELTAQIAALQEQNRKEKYPSGPEKTSGDQCTGSCIFLYFSCESKNRGNRNPEIFRKYEAGSERGYTFQSASGRTYKAGDCRAISEGILGICRYKYSGKASGRM